MSTVDSSVLIARMKYAYHCIHAFYEKKYDLRFGAGVFAAPLNALLYSVENDGQSVSGSFAVGNNSRKLCRIDVEEDVVNHIIDTVPPESPDAIEEALVLVYQRLVLTAECAHAAYLNGTLLIVDKDHNMLCLLRPQIEAKDANVYIYDDYEAVVNT